MRKNDVEISGFRAVDTRPAGEAYVPYHYGLNSSVGRHSRNDEAPPTKRCPTCRCPIVTDECIACNTERMMAKSSQTRMELFKVTEWKDGCVYKTKSLGLIWVPDDVADKTKFAVDNGGDLLVSLSPSKYTYEELYRRV